jgi:alcohol dehydrogenase class IV
MGFQAPATPEAMARAARALGVVDPVAGMHALARELGVPTALKELGMPESGIERVTELVVANPYANVRPIDRESIRGLLTSAYTGIAA